HLARRALRRARNLIAINEFHAFAFKLTPDLPASLKVPRNKNKEEGGKTLPQTQKPFGDQSLFSRMGAAANEHRSTFRHAQLTKHTGDVEQPPLFKFGGVELQTADHVDRFRTATQLAQSRSIGVVLRAYAGKSGKQRTE